METAPLRLLMIEDSEEDAYLLLRHLKRQGFNVQSRRVDNARTMREALQTEQFDAVCSDHNMPQFDSFGALETLHASGQDLPFIVVSASIGEETAVELMRRGAHDFVMKDNTARLVPVIERELREAQNRRERRDALDTLRQRNEELEAINQRLRVLIESSKRIAACPDIRTLGKAALREFAELMGAQGGSLFLREKDSLHLIFSLDERHAPISIPFPLRPDSVFGKVWKDQQPLVIQDIGKEYELSKSGWNGYQNGSLLALPLLDITGEMFGIVALHNKPDAPFAIQDREMGMILGSMFCESRRAVVATEILRQSEEAFRALAENSLDTIARFDTQYRHLYVNPIVETLTGIPANAYLGKTHAELGFPEDLCRLFEENIRHVIKTKQVNRVEYRLPSGIVLDWLLVPEFNKHGAVKSVITSARDITQRQRLEEDYRKLMGGVEQAAEIFIITDTKGNIEYVNPAFETVTGYSREEALCQNPRFLKSEKHDDVFYKEMWDTISSGKTWRGRLHNKRKDGSLFIEDSVISPVRDKAGNIVQYMGVKVDVTREVELETQLRQAQKMEAIGQLAGGVAHDFNNLLQAIMGYAEMAKMDLEERHPVQEHIDEIARAGQRATMLVRQLLAFSRRQVMNSEILDLNQVIEDLLKMLRRVIGENIQLTFAPSICDLFISADRGMMEQILMNLCVNARDAMPEGGKLMIETAQVSLDKSFCQKHSWAKPGDYVRFTVADNGCGMDQTTQERIFEPFFTTKEPGKGTGLGLATVYGIVRQHNGLIQLVSEAGKGTAFSIYLPITQNAAKSSENTVKEEVAGGSETLLVGEDEEQVRNFIVRVLTNKGYQVLSAPDGEEAWRIFNARATDIDMVLLDLVMPKMSGQEVQERIKEVRPEMPVMFMSGYSVDILQNNFAEKEDAYLLQKPYTPQQLLAQIRAILDARKR